MKRKHKKKIKLILAIAIAAVITAIAVWSAWFGHNNPETGLQYMASLAEHGQAKKTMDKNILFLGDSITAREDWNVLFGVSNITNAGISGNTTDDVIARLNSALASQPEKIFLMIGVNDLLRGKEVSYVLANYGIILDAIKSHDPGAKVYVQSVLPVNNDLMQSESVDSQKIIALNGQLKSLAQKDGYFFIDLYPHFCGADNKMYKKYAPDGLHPDAPGYAIWKNLIRQYLN